MCNALCTADALISVSASKDGRVKTRYEMPLLLLCGFGFSAFFTAVGLVAYTVVVLATVFGNGPFTSFGREVSRGTFLREALPLLLAFPTVLGFFGVVAYGLWKEKPWSRTTMMAFWLVSFLATLGVSVFTPAKTGDFVASLIGHVLLAALAGWYLYGNAGVVEYYRTLANVDRHHAEEGHGQPSASGA
jgi:hypothetical protein